jgi:hypothetical protein
VILFNGKKLVLNLICKISLFPPFFYVVNLVRKRGQIQLNWGGDFYGKGLKIPRIRLIIIPLIILKNGKLLLELG